MTDILISIRPQFVNLIISGQKTVEIRNRPVRLASGSKLWIYSTLPKGCIEAVATVHSVEVNSPDSIWKRFQDKTGLSEEAFLMYINGADQISAIVLRDVKSLDPSLTLQDLRSQVSGFVPPQFLARLRSPSELVSLLGNKRVKLNDIVISCRRNR